MFAAFNLRSLSLRIVVLVVAALAVFTLALGVTAYSVTRTWLEQTAVSNLEALASARQAAIEAQLSEYLGRLDAFVHLELEDRVARLVTADPTSPSDLRSEIEAEMRRKKTAYYDLVWIKILDLEGKLLAASSRDSTDEGIRTAVAGFEQGRDRPIVTDPFPVGGRIFLHLVTPLHDRQGDAFAVAVLRFDARKILSIVGDYTGLGDTGETVLGSRRDNQVHFLAPLRFDPNLSEIEPAPADGERAKPMIHATAGQSGTTRAPDYREIQVIAAYRPISQTGWGIVVKQDAEENLASVARLQATLVGGLVALLFLGAITTFPLVYTLMRPLRELETATRQVAQGDLSARVPVTTGDEVGRLAQSFNAMVGHLETARRDLERRNEELSSFAHVVSHDLKAPLRAIDGLASWLEEDLTHSLEAEQRERLAMMRDRVQRMNMLVAGLLEFSRVGRVNNPATTVDLQQLLRSVIEAVDPPETIRVSVYSDLPVIDTEELPLGQVLRNLIHNAVKHHPGPGGHVEVGFRDRSDRWEFTVKDDGAGVDPRYHQRIFEAFQTLQSWDEGHGTGIGLALVKKTVDGRGGEVWIESVGNPGRGSTFGFTWPKNAQGSGS